MKEYVFLLELLQSNFQKIVSDFSVLETTIQPLRVVANESDSKVLTWKTECLIRLSNIVILTSSLLKTYFFFLLSNCKYHWVLKK